MRGGGKGKEEEGGFIFQETQTVWAFKDFGDKKKGSCYFRFRIQRTTQE